MDGWSVGRQMGVEQRIRRAGKQMGGWMGRWIEDGWEGRWMTSGWMGKKEGERKGVYWEGRE